MPRPATGLPAPLYTLALVAALGLAACSVESRTGQARVLAVVNSTALSATQVSRIAIRVTAAGIVPIDAALARVGTSTTWSGTIGKIPAGSGRHFVANAFDANNGLLFTGSADYDIVGGQTAQVLINLQDANPPPPPPFYVPHVTSLFASTLSTPRDRPVHVQATVDYKGTDALVYAWTATGGAFGAPGSLESDWTPPADGQTSYTLTFRVTNQAGDFDTSGFAITVTAPADGSATVTVSFNTSPLVTSIHPSASHVFTGDTFTLTATATDAEQSQGELTWEWESTNCYAIGGNSTPSVTFISPAYTPPNDLCDFTVVVRDGQGGVGYGYINIPWGRAAAVALAPQITFNQSARSEYLRGAVVVGGQAAGGSTTDNNRYRWTYTASGGTLDSNTGCQGVDGTCAQINWHAPACTDPLPSVTLDVLDPSSGAHTTNVFTLDTCAPRGCQAALDASPSALVTSGATLIDPDGAGPLEPFSVYCDNTSFGGGWAQFGAVGASAIFYDDNLVNVGTLNGHFNGNLAISSDQPVAIDNNSHWGFLPVDSFAGFGNDFTVRIDIEIPGVGVQHSFIRPRNTCAQPGTDCQPGWLGLNAIKDVTGGTSSGTYVGGLDLGVNAHFQLLDLSTVAFANPNLTWVDMPAYEDDDHGRRVFFFGYRSQALNDGRPCNDPTTGATVLCHAPGGPAGTTSGGTYSHAQDVPGGVTHAHGRVGRYFIKDRNVPAILP
jgi:hypothetical protein